MKIEKQKVVSINYTLTNDDGDILDSSNGRGPLTYIQGMGQLIPGLEKELEGKVKSDTLKAVISPEEAYGVRNDSLLQSIPRSEFATIPDLKEGMQFQVDTAGSGPMVITVVKIEDENVLVDGNHPLADVTLHFDVTVVDVREATEIELESGHVGGCGGGSCGSGCGDGGCGDGGCGCH